MTRFAVWILASAANALFSSITKLLLYRSVCYLLSLLVFLIGLTLARTILHLVYTVYTHTYIIVIPLSRQKVAHKKKIYFLWKRLVSVPQVAISSSLSHALQWHQWLMSLLRRSCEQQDRWWQDNHSTGWWWLTHLLLLLAEKRRRWLNGLFVVVRVHACCSLVQTVRGAATGENI